jgi:excinuclease ABC subunit A
VILPWGEPSGYIRKVILPTLARAFKFDLNTRWKDLPVAAKKAILHGAPGKTFTYQYHSERWQGTYESGWTGVLRHVEKRYRESASDTVREQLEGYMVQQPCPTCGGRRLRPESLSVLITGKSIGDVVTLPVSDTLAFFESLPLRGNGRPGLDPEFARPIPETDRLRFQERQPDYLTLERRNAVRRRGAAHQPATKSAAASSACSSSTASIGLPSGDNADYETLRSWCDLQHGPRRGAR